MSEQNPSDPMDIDNNNASSETKDTKNDTSDSTTNNTTAPPSKSNSSAAYKLIINRIYRTLVVGCGRTYCDNVYCFSNPGRKKFVLSNSEAAILSATLLRLHSEVVCPEVLPGSKLGEPVDFIDIEKFENLVLECQKSNNFTSLIRIIGQVFGSLESLTISFLKHPKAILTDGTDTGLEITDVRKFYSIMDGMPDNLQNVLANALYRLVDGLKFEVVSLSRSSLRKFIIMLEHPKLLDEKYYPRFTGQLYSAIVNLPPSSQLFLKENYVFKYVIFFLCYLI